MEPSLHDGQPSKQSTMHNIMQQHRYHLHQAPPTKTKHPIVAISSSKTSLVISSFHRCGSILYIF
eukprot:scaffold10522_cov124-Alexandrium_tamarense.AAC.1